MVDGDGWICLNDGEKKIVQRMRLKTEKKGLTGKSNLEGIKSKQKVNEWLFHKGRACLKAEGKTANYL